MTLQDTKNDNAIAFRCYELLDSGEKIEPLDYITVTLPSTFTMEARGEWSQPTSERVEAKHIEIARQMLRTPFAQWEARNLA